MSLLNLFVAVARKRLKLVDLPIGASNQHEVNGVSVLREFFDTRETVKGEIDWHLIADDGPIVHEVGAYTFYDARAKGSDRTGRSEWRLYYTGDFLRAARAGDMLVLARTRDERLHGLVLPEGSSLERLAPEIFGDAQVRESFTVSSPEQLRGQELEFARRRIAERLGFDVPAEPTATDEEIVRDSFGGMFPTTRAMSELARSVVCEHSEGDADELLVSWLDREEQLFAALELSIIGERLTQPFKTVDEFTSFALSMLNRRKSRMGHALENQLEALFLARGVQYERGASTEDRNRPDFLFPSSGAYRDATFAATRLAMLAAKSTLKDRWRQVLTEAARIPTKHLCTLEPGISEHQTQEIESRSVVLVVPQRLHGTFSVAQRARLWSVEQFVQFVAGLDGAGGAMR
jgi:hypothetical protein